MTASKVPSYLVSGSKEQMERSYGSTPGSIQSKKKSMAGFGVERETAQSKRQTKKRVEFDLAKAAICK